MSAPCEMCNGTQIARYEDKPTPGTIGGEGTGVIICSACSVVVSIEEYASLCKLRDQIVKHTLDFPEGIAALAGSLQDAEVAAAVKEIEAEDLVAERHLISLPGDPMRMRWAVFSHRDSANVGYGDSISAALTAHKNGGTP